MRDRGVRRSEEGGAEAVAERESVRQLNRADAVVGLRGSGLALDNRGDILEELMAGELGGRREGSKDVDEELPIAKSDIRLGPGADTHSSPRKNSAVNARCSRERLEDNTPPYNSASRTVPSAERFAVLCDASAASHSVPLSTHLEGEVFEGMRDTSLGLKAAARLHEERDGGSRLADVDGGNLDASRVSDSGKRARDALDAAGSRSPGREHRRELER